MIELGILKNFDSGTYKAGVQLAGSLTTYFDDISVAKNIPSGAMVIGNYVIVAIPGGNPRDACVIATWPGGSPGGGSKIQDADGDTSWDTEQSADEDKIHGKVKGVEAFLLDDAGILTLAKQSAARAYKGTADQTVPNQTVTKVVLDAENYDIQGEFDPVTNSRFTAKAAGLYLCIGMLDYQPVVDAKVYQIRIHKNNVVFQAANCYSSGTDVASPLIVAVAFLAANDYLEVYAYQASGVAATLKYYWNGCWFSVAKIA